MLVVKGILDSCWSSEEKAVSLWGDQGGLPRRTAFILRKAEMGWGKSRRGATGAEAQSWEHPCCAGEVTGGGGGGAVMGDGGGGR